MSKLVLRIDKYLDSDGGSPPEAFARIQTLDPSTGRNLSPNMVRQERVPISNQQSAGRGIDVSPGYYQIEAVLPSGEILTDSIEVKEGTNTELVLKAADSPHEWLGWQHLMGNVIAKAQEGVAVAKDVTKLIKEVSSSGKAAKKKTPVAPPPAAPAAPPPAAPSADAPGPAAGAEPDMPLPHMAIGQPMHWLSNPLAELGSAGWITVLKRASTPDEWLNVLNSGAPARAIQPYNSDPQRAIFRVTHGSSNASSAQPLQSHLPRDFVVIKRPRTVELASLPLPWAVIGTGREAVVEVVVQQLVRSEDFATSIAVRDERMGLLLGFLSSGALSAAQQIAEDARDMLFGKVENPLAAAAGGYAMVGTDTDSKEKDWHGWIANLKNYFPHVPDGAIQWATLMQRRGQSRYQEACEGFKEACRRGPPFYSLGLRWLLEGLERFAGRDPEAASMAHAVRAIASRMHQQSPFTIIRLGERGTFSK